MNGYLRYLGHHELKAIRAYVDKCLDAISIGEDVPLMGKEIDYMWLLPHLDAITQVVEKESADLCAMALRRAFVLHSRGAPLPEFA